VGDGLAAAAAELHGAAAAGSLGGAAARPPGRADAGGAAVRGRDAAAAIAVWAAFNVVLSSLMFLFTGDLMSHAVYWLGVFWLVPLIALAVTARERATRRLPQASGGAALLALALALVALGAGVGLWAVLCGAAVGVVAVVLLVMERSA
jgi:hypothetical protein